MENQDDREDREMAQELQYLDGLRRTLRRCDQAALEHRRVHRRQYAYCPSCAEISDNVRKVRAELDYIRDRLTGQCDYDCVVFIRDEYRRRQEEAARRQAAREAAERRRHEVGLALYNAFVNRQK